MEESGRWWPIASFTSLRRQAIIICSAAPTVSAIGFSQRIACGLKAAAVTVQGACPLCQVQIETTSGRSFFHHFAAVGVVRGSDVELFVLFGHCLYAQIGQGDDFIATGGQITVNVIGGYPACAYDGST